MSIPFSLTTQPIRVTAVGFQPLQLALDIRRFDALDVSLGILALEGTLPTVTVQLWSGLQNQSDSGYVPLYDFGNKSGVYNTYYRAMIQRDQGLLSFLRWRVTALGGTAPAATFFIRGVGRSFAEHGGARG